MADFAASPDIIVRVSMLVTIQTSPNRPTLGPAILRTRATFRRRTRSMVIERGRICIKPSDRRREAELGS
jgi:hypothetical protein